MPKLGWIIFLLAAVAVWGLISSCSENSTNSETPTRPADPTNLVGVALDIATISLTWQDNSNNEDGFRLYDWDGEWAAFGTTEADSTSYLVTGRLPMMEYQYKVKAYNSFGESDFSNSVAVQTKGFPTPPEDLTLQALSHNRIFVSWTDMSDDELHFAVQRRTQADTFSTIGTTTANDTSYADSIGLNSGTLYYYRVGAVGIEATGWSNENTVHTWVHTVPEAPTNLEAELLAESRVNLTWQDNSSYELYFVIFRAQGEGGLVALDTVTANTTTYLDTSVLELETYRYLVRALNEIGPSVGSNEVEIFTTPISPGAIPLAPGNQWNYLVDSSGSIYTLQIDVPRAEIVERVTWFLIRETTSISEEVDTTFFYRNDLGHGVLYRKHDGQEAHLLWQYPAIKNDYYFVEEDCVLVFTTRDNLQIPAGFFTGCYGFRRFTDDETIIETFIKPDIGILKVQISDSIETTYTQELESYDIWE